MLAIVTVRDGRLPAGADEAVAECGGTCLLVGDNLQPAIDDLVGVAAEVFTVTSRNVQPLAVTAALTSWLHAYPRVVLPGSADGRDLAPHLAVALNRPAFVDARDVSVDGVTVIGDGGTSMWTVKPPPDAFVATLAPGLRSVHRTGMATTPTVAALDIEIGQHPADALSVAVDPPDAATVDLSEAGRIVAGGAGLDSAERFDTLGDFANLIGASVGATRVITDRGWIDHSRQIGTTGVMVDPDLYLAFGVSGAVQHTAGLGHPTHIVSVNTDPHCPMMQLADLAIVCDANELIEHLVGQLSAAPAASPPTASPEENR